MSGRRISRQGAYRSAVTTARRRLGEIGLALPTQPDEKMPSLPRDLGEIADSELMRLYSLFVAWTDYLGVAVAEAEVEESEASNALAVLETRIVLSSNEKITKARMEKDIDEKVQDAAASTLNARAYRKLLAALYTSAERDSGALSRELTRRLERSKHEHRESRYNP